jgi:hypothetical protein
MLIVRLTRTCNLLCTFQLDASEARLAAKELAPLYRLTLFTVWAFPASLNVRTIERRTAPSAGSLRSVQNILHRLHRLLVLHVRCRWNRRDKARRCPRYCCWCCLASRATPLRDNKS